MQFLVDASRSMALEQPTSRAAQVQRTIQEVHAELKQPDNAQIQLFRFGDRLASAADLAQLRPADDASRLAEALEQLPSRFTRELPKGIVVFSDGAVEDADRLAFRRERFDVCRYSFELPRAMTSRPGSWPSFPRTSSVMPSAK